MDKSGKLSKKDEKVLKQYFLDESRERKASRKYITQKTIDQIKKIDKKNDYVLRVYLEEIMISGMHNERAYNERKQKRIIKQT